MSCISTSCFVAIECFGTVVISRVELVWHSHASLKSQCVNLIFTINFCSTWVLFKVQRPVKGGKPRNSVMIVCSAAAVFRQAPHSGTRAGSGPAASAFARATL